jgi:hypothetical protein
LKKNKDKSKWDWKLLEINDTTVCTITG